MYHALYLIDSNTLSGEFVTFHREEKENSSCDKVVNKALQGNNNNAFLLMFSFIMMLK
jgi:ribonuclease HI